MVWDDIKNPGNSLTAAEWNAMTADQKSRVFKSLFDANTILKADSNDTPVALTLAEQRILGRITGGTIAALTAAQVRTLIDFVAQVKATKLDDFAAPDDNTDLNASTSKHGLLKKLGGGTTNYLRADGTWAQPAGGGVTTWLALTDTPGAFDNGKIVKSGVAALSFGMLESDIFKKTGAVAMTGDLNVGYLDIDNVKELYFNNNVAGVNEKVHSVDPLEFWIGASHRFDVLSTFAIGMFDDLGMGSHDIKKVHELIMNDACSIKPEGNTGNKYFFLKGYDDTEFAQVGNLYLHLSNLKLKTAMDANSQNIINVPTPTLSHHAVNKSYADSLGGVTTWLALTDTPGAFTSQKGMLPRVNNGETSLEFKHNAIPTTFVVAANDAKDKLRSDYDCDASADQTEINNAITALPT